MRKTYKEEIEFLRTTTQPIILFGAGATCLFNLQYFRKLGIEPAAFCDNASERQGQFVDNLKILSLEDAKKLYPGAYYYITTQLYYREIREQLIKAGISTENITYYDIIFQLQWEEDCMEYYKKNRESLEKIYYCLEDEESRLVMENRMRFLQTRDRRYILDIRKKDSYFDADLIDFKTVRTFVDLGMYTGDTIMDYIVKCQGKYTKIYGFEPDKKLMEKAKENLNANKNIEFVCKATSDYNGTIQVNQALGVMQTIEDGVFDTAAQENYFEVCSLDSFFGEREHSAIDMLKMDIEGAELTTLRGAKKLIQEEKPILAVCIYHRINDIIKIPEFIQSLDTGGYRFYMRHYSDNQTETVCYMIPKSREKMKPSYDTNRQVLGKIYPLTAPFTIILDASEACNFKCSYCFRSSEKSETWGDYAVKKNLMNWDIFQSAVGQIKQFPVEAKHIALSCHGEPLCNRHLPKMVRYIKESGLTCKVSIHTNASLLDETYAMELAECGIDKIVVSLQGLDAETYQKVCGVTLDFKRFYDNLKILYTHKKANTVLNIKIMDVAVGACEEEFYEKFSKIADTVFIEKMVPIWKNTGVDTHPNKVQNKYGAEFPYQECCPLIFNTLVVTPEGDVYPCTQILSKECLGNISEHTLVEFWNSQERIELLRRQLLLNPPESCNGCYIRQNSIFTKEDMVDDYREDILKRLEKQRFCNKKEVSDLTLP